MKIQVKYNELETLGNDLAKKKKDIDDILDNIQKVLDDSKTAWQGKDSDSFNIRADETIMKEKERNNKIEVLSEAILYAAKHYKSEDEEWLETIKKVEQDA